MDMGMGSIRRGDVGHVGPVVGLGVATKGFVSLSSPVPQFPHVQLEEAGWDRRGMLLG